MKEKNNDKIDGIHFGNNTCALGALHRHFAASAAEGSLCTADSCAGSYTNGICSAAPTHDQPAVESGVGAIVGIAAGCTVLPGGGGFALYWFVIRKRRS